MVWSWKLSFLLQKIVDTYYALVLKDLKEGEVEVFVKKLVNTFFWIALGPLQQQDDGPNYEHNGVKNILNSQLILVFSTLLSRREICKQNFAKTLVNKNLYVRLQKDFDPNVLSEVVKSMMTGENLKYSGWIYSTGDERGDRSESLYTLAFSPEHPV